MEEPPPEINLQCIECAQSEDLNRQEIELVKPHNKVSEAIQQKITEADQLFHIHDIEDCQRPASRALLAKQM